MAVFRAGSEFTEMRFKDISIEDVIIDAKELKHYN